MNKSVITVSLILLLGSGCGFAQESKGKLTPEQQLTQEYFTLAFQKKDTAAAAKVKAKLLKKYPRGKFARREMAEHLNMSNPEAYIKEAEAFRKAFPISEYIAHPDDQGYVYVNFYNAYSRFLYKQKMYDRLEEVMKEMSFDMLVDLYRHTVMFNIMKAPIDPGSYVDIAEKMTREMIAKAPERYDFYGDGKKVDASQQLKDLNYYLAVETEILQRSGRNGDAVNCLNRIADPQVRYNQYPQGNEAYVKALVALGRNDVKPYNSRSPYVMLPDNPVLTGMFRSLEGFFDAGHCPSEQLMEAKIKEVILTLIEMMPELKSVLFDFVEPWKVDLREYMNANFASDLDLEGFAHYTGRSLSAFKKDFVEAFHESPMKWIVSRRLQEARQLMEQQGERANDVYLRVGFKNLSHFSTAFKRQYGIPPSALVMA